MTVIIKVECDASGCCEELETRRVDDEEEIEAAGWIVDPHASLFHYCPNCKQEVLEEMREE